MSTELETNLREILNEKTTKILPENIKKDTTIFGITGTLESLDTSDATATANDIISPKTAYVNGEKITGNIIPEYKNVEYIISTDSNVTQSSIFNSVYVGTTLLSHNKFAVINSGNINIYDVNNNYTISETYSLSNLGISTIYTIIKSGVYDTQNNCYYMILLTTDGNNQNVGKVIKYNPDNKVINYLGNTNIGWDYFNALTNIICSPTNPRLFFGIVHQPKSGFVAINILNDTVNTFQLPVNYENRNDNLISYGITSNDEIYIHRTNTNYCFKINSNVSSSYNTIQNNTGYNIYTCSIDGSKAVINNGTTYLCDFSLDRDNLSLSVSNLVEIPSKYLIYTFTKINNVLYAKNTSSGSLVLLEYKDNMFKEYIVDTTNANFIIPSSRGTAKEILSDLSGWNQYVSGTELISQKILENSKVLSSLRVKNTYLIDTSDANVTANDIASGKVAYNQNGKIIGNVHEVISGELTGAGTSYFDSVFNVPNSSVIGIISNTPVDTFVRTGAKWRNLMNYADLAEAIGLTADKIKAGETILGITGTYEPNYTDLGTISPTEYDTAVSTSENILGTNAE